MASERPCPDDGCTAFPDCYCGDVIREIGKPDAPTAPRMVTWTGRCFRCLETVEMQLEAGVVPDSWSFHRTEYCSQGVVVWERPNE